MASPCSRFRSFKPPLINGPRFQPSFVRRKDVTARQFQNNAEQTQALQHKNLRETAPTEPIFVRPGKGPDRAYPIGKRGQPLAMSGQAALTMLAAAGRGLGFIATSRDAREARWMTAVRRLPAFRRGSRKQGRNSLCAAWILVVQRCRSSLSRWTLGCASRMASPSRQRRTRPHARAGSISAAQAGDFIRAAADALSNQRIHVQRIIGYGCFLSVAGCKSSLWGLPDDQPRNGPERTVTSHSAAGQSATLPLDAQPRDASRFRGLRMPSAGWADRRRKICRVAPRRAHAREAIAALFGWRARDWQDLQTRLRQDLRWKDRRADGRVSRYGDL